jgi:hypothetical protein
MGKLLLYHTLREQWQEQSLHMLNAEAILTHNSDPLLAWCVNMDPRDMGPTI